MFPPTRGNTWLGTAGLGEGSLSLDFGNYHSDHIHHSEWSRDITRPILTRCISLHQTIFTRCSLHHVIKTVLPKVKVKVKLSFIVRYNNVNENRRTKLSLSHGSLIIKQNWLMKHIRSVILKKNGMY